MGKEESLEKNLKKIISKSPIEQELHEIKINDKLNNPSINKGAGEEQTKGVGLPSADNLRGQDESPSKSPKKPIRRLHILTFVLGIIFLLILVELNIWWLVSSYSKKDSSINVNTPEIPINNQYTNNFPLNNTFVINVDLDKTLNQTIKDALKKALTELNITNITNSS